MKELINWLKERLKEPSTWASIAVVFAMVLPGSEAQWVKALESLGIAVEAVVAVIAAFGFLLSEKSKKTEVKPVPRAVDPGTGGGSRA